MAALKSGASVAVISVAEVLGLDPVGLWRLAWLLFFVRLTLGFFVGIDDVLHGFKAMRSDRAAHEREGRMLRRANLVVTVVHVAMLAAFALAVLRVPTV
jgi:hypothetical protein